ncbi:glycosyltransferase family 39 protein [Nocardia inohanensis]|uniref:glycosyltransferase family 39 protein n=1 Tax=Nocardia inohanensis TaxID=209246 RepID=UPI000A06A879|nr:glycosyltransferase family 39 protein [Nocardia inohanensis]
MTAMTGVSDEALPHRADGVSRWAGWFSGPPGHPRWERPATLALLVSTAVLYLWGLGGAGWTNQYYAAAVQAGTQSWKALLFASLDSQNAITVDKPPVAMWVMGVSGRVFGFNSWSMLVPEALMGVAAVGLLVASVRRWAGPAAGLLAGIAFAVTPVAALMFRYDNPDAMLMLLLVAAAYCTVRAVAAEGAKWWSASTGWLVAAGVLMGFGFLTKMMQAFLILPGLGLVVLVAGAGGVGLRIKQLLTAAAALVISSGWYVALVALWPAGSRPYIGGSTTNSLWELAVDYNGVGRILGNNGRGGMPNYQPATGNGISPTDSAAPATGGGVPATGGELPSTGGGQFPRGMAGFGSKPGVTRLFTGELGTEFSWLLPAAVIALLAGLWLTRRAARTDRVRAALLLWGGWLLVTALVLSTMSRSFHSYYSIALAPAMAALVAIGATQLWSRRAHPAARATLAATLVLTGGWAFVLLRRTPDWLPTLRWAVLAAAIAAAAFLLLPSRSRRATRVIAAAALLSVLVAPTAYAVETVAQPHSGGSPVAGPPRNSRTPTRLGNTPLDPQISELITTAGTRWAAAAVGASDVSALELQTGAPLLAVGGFSGRDDFPTLEQFQQYVADREIGYFLVRQRQQNQQGGEAETAGQPSANPTGGPEEQRREEDQSTSARITAWVKANYPETVIGNMAVYRLTP